MNTSTGKDTLSFIRLIASREFKQRTTSRAFKIAALITALVAFAYVVVPHIIESRNSTKTIGVVAPYPAYAKAVLLEIAHISNLKVHIETLKSIGEAKAQVSSGKIFIAYSASSGLLVKSATTTNSAYIYAKGVAGALARDSAIANAHLSAIQKLALLRTKTPAVSAVQIGPTLKPGTQKASIFELILMYTLLSQYSAWVMLGVVEEKSTRVIEVLLAIVKPTQLLIGKILGIARVAAVHASLIIVALMAGLYAIGSNPLSVLPGGLLVVALAWLLVGGFMYCILFGAMGSTVSRVEDAQAVSFPLALPMLIGYGLGFYAISQAPSTSALIKVLAFIPGVSPFIDPVLFASGVMSPSELMLSLAISLLATWLLSKLAVRLYRSSILKMGSRVPFGSMRHALSKQSAIGS